MALAGVGRASGDEELTPEDLARLRNNWLQLHDKLTAGIMGLLPLVRGMPMRLTGTENAAKQAYKNARCTLLGWKLTAAETARVEACPDNELVLVDRPLVLRVQIVKPRTIATAADTEDDGPVLDLKPRVCTWTRDPARKAKVIEMIQKAGGDRATAAQD